MSAFIIQHSPGQHCNMKNNSWGQRYATKRSDNTLWLKNRLCSLVNFKLLKSYLNQIDKCNFPRSLPFYVFQFSPCVSHFESTDGDQ